jgi:hypothetical protein
LVTKEAEIGFTLSRTDSQHGRIYFRNLVGNVSFQIFSSAKFVLKALSFNRPHRKKYGGMKSGDRGGQIPSEIIISLDKLLISPNIWLNQ